MRKIFIALLLALPLFAMGQFRIVGTGLFFTLNDSTYRARIDFRPDLTGNSYNPTQLNDSMYVLSQAGQLYRLDSFFSADFSSAWIVLVEKNGNWGSPVGQIMVFETPNSVVSPQAVYAANGSTANMQAAVDTWNARILRQIADSTSIWTESYNNMIDSVYFSGGVNKTLTLLQHDGDTLNASFNLADSDQNLFVSAENSNSAGINLTIQENFDGPAYVVIDSNNAVPWDGLHIVGKIIMRVTDKIIVQGTGLINITETASTIGGTINVDATIPTGHVTYPMLDPAVQDSIRTIVTLEEGAQSAATIVVDNSNATPWDGLNVVGVVQVVGNEGEVVLTIDGQQIIFQIGSNLSFPDTSGIITLDNNQGTDVYFKGGENVNLSSSNDTMEISVPLNLSILQGNSNEAFVIVDNNNATLWDGIGVLSFFYTGITITLNNETITFYPIENGDKNDIVVTDNGETWTIDTAVINWNNLTSALKDSITLLRLDTSEFVKFTDTLSTIATKYDNSLKLNISDTAAMLAPYLRNPIDSLLFNTSYEGVATTGEMIWNATNGTVNLGLQGGIEMPLGQGEAHMVRNKTGSTIAKGKAVYISGATGQRPEIKLADADGELSSSVTFGVTAEEILPNDTGFVFTSGYIKGVNTSGYIEGEALWLDTIPGGWTHTKYYAPIHTVLIGYVVTAKNNGEIFVKIQNGYELDELHNVNILGAVNKASIYYDSLSGLWRDTVRSILVTDTASMLSPYLRKADTLSLSNRINLKLNISDTTAMLSSYLRKVDTLSLSNRINLKLNASDTIKYVKYADTLTTIATKTDLSTVQQTLTLTTNGTEGVATLSNDTLNIPNYADTSIYNANGTLSGERIVNLNNNRLLITQNSTGGDTTFIGRENNLGYDVSVKLKNTSGTVSTETVLYDKGLESYNSAGLQSYLNMNAGEFTFRADSATRVGTLNSEDMRINTLGYIRMRRAHPDPAVTLMGRTTDNWITNVGLTGNVKLTGGVLNYDTTSISNRINNKLDSIAGEVTTFVIRDTAVTTDKIATGAVTGVKLGSITSSQLQTALSDETGTGAAVFATSPVMSSVKVNGAGLLGGSLNLNYTGAGFSTGILSFSARDTAKWTLTTNITNNNINFYNAASVTYPFTIKASNDYVGISTFDPQRTLHVTGEVRISDLSTDTPTRIVGADADGDLDDIKIGKGLELSNDTLRVISQAPVTVTDATYTVADGVKHIICTRNDSITITLPNAADWIGREITIKQWKGYQIKSASSNVVPFASETAGDTIIASAETNGSWVLLVSNGTNWIIMQRTKF